VALQVLRQSDRNKELRSQGGTGCSSPAPGWLQPWPRCIPAEQMRCAPPATEQRRADKSPYVPSSSPPAPTGGSHARLPCLQPTWPQPFARMPPSFAHLQRPLAALARCSRLPTAHMAPTVCPVRFKKNSQLPVKNTHLQRPLAALPCGAELFKQLAVQVGLVLRHVGLHNMKEIGRVNVSAQEELLQQLAVQVGLVLRHVGLRKKRSRQEEVQSCDGCMMQGPRQVSRVLRMLPWLTASSRYQVVHSASSRACCTATNPTPNIAAPTQAHRQLGVEAVCVAVLALAGTHVQAAVTGRERV